MASCKYYQKHSGGASGCNRVVVGPTTLSTGEGNAIVVFFTLFDFEVINYEVNKRELSVINLQARAAHLAIQTPFRN